MEICRLPVTLLIGLSFQRGYILKSQTKTECGDRSFFLKLNHEFSVEGLVILSFVFNFTRV